jgi:serum/glucocorticoid-regulated kinase 2
MYEKIVRNPLTFSDVFGSEAKAILKGLLTRDPATRLGSKGADEIRKHPFFAKHIDFKALGEKRVVPPFKPNVVSLGFVSTLGMIADVLMIDERDRYG